MRFPNWGILSIFVNSSCRRPCLFLNQFDIQKETCEESIFHIGTHKDILGSFFNFVKCNSHSLCRIYAPYSLVKFLLHKRLTEINCIALEETQPTPLRKHTWNWQVISVEYDQFSPAKMLDSRRSKRHDTFHASNGYKFYFTYTGPLAKCSVF